MGLPSDSKAEDRVLEPDIAPVRFSEFMCFSYLLRAAYDGI